MALFEYKIQTPTGEILINTLQGVSKEEVASTLTSEGNKVLSIKDVSNTVFATRKKKVSTYEKSTFCRFMSTMMNSGLSIAEGSDVISQETTNSYMKEILADLAYQTRRGASVYSALSKYPKVFDPVMLALVKTGEESGSLDKSFEYLSDQLRASYELEQKVKSSLAYPAVIVVAMFAIGTFMLIAVLPRVSGSFSKLNIEMPFMTRMIMSFGNFVGANTLLVVGMIGFFIAFVVFLFSVPKVRHKVVNLMGYFKPINKVMTQIDIARYSRTLSTLLKRGVSIVVSLDIASDTISQPKLKTAAKAFGPDVSKGELLSNVVLKHKNMFPPMMVQTIKAGEKSGALDKVLGEMAEFYESEVDHSLKRLTTLLEPILILIIGVVVGGMAVMLVYPIYSVIGNLQATMKK